MCVYTCVYIHACRIMCLCEWQKRISPTSKCLQNSIYLWTMALNVILATWVSVNVFVIWMSLVCRGEVCMCLCTLFFVNVLYVCSSFSLFHAHFLFSFLRCFFAWQYSYIHVLFVFNSWWRFVSSRVKEEARGYVTWISNQFMMTFCLVQSERGSEGVCHMNFSWKTEKDTELWKCTQQLSNLENTGKPKNGPRWMKLLLDRESCSESLLDSTAMAQKHVCEKERKRRKATRNLKLRKKARVGGIKHTSQWYYDKAFLHPIPNITGHSTNRVKCLKGSKWA